MKKQNRRILIVMIVLSLFLSGLMLAGNGNGNGGGNTGSGPADGTGYGTVMVTAAAHSLQTERVSEAATVVQMDMVQEMARVITDGGPGDGTGNGPGDCTEIAEQMTANRAYSMEEVAQAFGLQVYQIEQLINQGDLQTIRVNNRLMIMGSEIQEKVDKIENLF